MRRRRFRKPAVNMSLFPFLAVLVCAMGVLIVLLMIVVQQARASASQAVEAQAHDQEAAQPGEVRQECDNFRWRREVLETQRAELARQLSDRRLQLSHLEDHIRRLEQRWRQSQEQAASFENIGAMQSADAAAAKQELARLQAEVETNRRQFEQAKEEAALRPRRFAIIPYDGPNGTQRRPIYVECTQDSITLQPEGIVLHAQDFAGPLGPGNPLDAALRATREYLAKTDDPKRNGEPYPLLVVRPDGAIAYAVARAAMKSWDDEFGYELVEADVELQYPPPDPALGQELQRAVQDARQRQAALAAAMPSQFQGDGASGFVATSTRGGFVRTGEPGMSAPTDFGQSGGFGDAGPGRAEKGSSSSNAPRRPGARPAADRKTDGSGRDAAPPRRDAAGKDGGQEVSSGAGEGDGGQSRPIAAARGRNWALPKATATATGITRPISIVCLNDQLVILPEKGDSRPRKVIATPGKLADVMDEFVSAIWEHVDQWGIAVAGGYWKPVLNVEVGRGADKRFEELEKLLEESGIEVKRKAR